jgi:hypothetical protein
MFTTPDPNLEVDLCNPLNAPGNPPPPLPSSGRFGDEVVFEVVKPKLKLVQLKGE